MNNIHNNLIKYNHSNHTNHKQADFNNDALKFQILEELPDQIKSYLSNFEIKDIRIIKSVLLKGKKSFNNAHDTYYRLEELEFEIVSVLKRFKSELEETHALNMRRQNISNYNIFNEKFK